MQPLDEIGEILRDGGFEGDGFFGAGVEEGDLPGMEELAANPGGGGEAGIATVGGVTDDGVAGVSGVDADLVGASGVEVEFKE